MSWEQLISIYKDAEQEVNRENMVPPVACPNDGEPLRTGPDGKLFCPFDGWKPEMR